jgi:hypothetical protein
VRFPVVHSVGVFPGLADPRRDRTPAVAGGRPSLATAAKGKAHFESLSSAFGALRTDAQQIEQKAHDRVDESDKHQRSVPARSPQVLPGSVR